MAIQYVTGDATAPIGDGTKIIAHVVNDVGKWGRGFVLALSAKWSLPKEAYLSWFRQVGLSFDLGSVQLVKISEHLYVCNMLAQHGLRKTNSGPPVQYDALQQCLEKLAGNAEFLRASVHMPRIGCGIGGGKWNKVEPLIEKALTGRGVAVTVYDLI